MAKCLLCRNAEADKRNSHLIPHFLIKTAINEDGSPRRDKELMFTISSSGFIEVFYGRDISPEKILEIHGKELSEEDIEKQFNDLARDYILCTRCELRFSVIEDYIAREVYSRLRGGDANKIEVDANGRQLFKFQLMPPQALQLFVYSIFWRFSAVQLNGFALKPNIEESLRRVLDRCLDVDLALVIEKCKEAGNCPFPIIVTYSTTNDNPTRNFIKAESTRFPYFIIGNDMTFQLFEKPKQVKSSVMHLHGLSGMISRLESVMLDNSDATIVNIAAEENSAIQLDTYAHLGGAANSSYKRYLTQFHRKIFKTDPPEDLIQLFLSKFLYEDTVSEASRYTQVRFIECAQNTYHEYGGGIFVWPIILEGIKNLKQ